MVSGSRTCPVGHTLDETFDIGWDKGTPVSEEYGPIAKFTGAIVRVDFDLHPDFHPDHADPETTSRPTSPTPCSASSPRSQPQVMAGVLSLAEFFSEANVRRITSQAEAAAHT